jgi:hypothetical protein
MSTKSLGLSKIIAHLRKSLTVRKETKRRGGLLSRGEARGKRLQTIRDEKLRIRDGLINSWALQEIPPPTDEEKRLFWLYHRSLSIEYLVGIQKKYWQQ